MRPTTYTPATKRVSRAEAMAEEARRKSTRFAVVTIFVGGLAVLVSALYQTADLGRRFSALVDTLQTAPQTPKAGPAKSSVPAAPAAAQDEGQAEEELAAAEKAGCARCLSGRSIAAPYLKSRTGRTLKATPPKLRPYFVVLRRP